MHFQALDVALQLISTLRAPVKRIQTHDRSLADQLRRAATSISLNLAEGRRRAGKDQRYLWRVALDLIDRILAMTWRLTH